MNYIKVVNTDTISIKELSDLASKIVKEHFDPIDAMPVVMENPVFKKMVLMNLYPKSGVPT